MKRYILVILISIIAFVSGCQHLPRSPLTLGEASSGYTYVPLDPFSVDTTNVSRAGTNISLTGTNLLQSLPDNAVRIAVESFDAGGNISYGPAGLSTKGGSYKITVDYINADTDNVKVLIARSVMVRKSQTASAGVVEERQLLGLTDPLPARAVHGTEHYYVKRVDGGLSTNSIPIPDIPGTNVDLSTVVAEFNVPIYIGIGLRVTADITTYQGSINISGLGAIGAAAEAKKLSGSLVVQTLGINGRSISAALPIQSELNQTTAQNAVVAVGAIKSLLYEPETVVVPRVVGLYLPFPGGKPLVNALISELSKQPVQWKIIAKAQ